MGFWETSVAEIPFTSTLAAIVLLLLNIFFPGVGTIIMSFMGGFKVNTLLCGILQLVLAFIIVGWIWSIYWGILCLQKAK